MRNYSLARLWLLTFVLFISFGFAIGFAPKPNTFVVSIYGVWALLVAASFVFSAALTADRFLRWVFAPKGTAAKETPTYER